MMPLTVITLYLAGCALIIIALKWEFLMKARHYIIGYILIGFLVFGWAANSKCSGYDARINECSLSWGAFWPITMLGFAALSITDPKNWPAIKFE